MPETEETKFRGESKTSEKELGRSQREAINSSADKRRVMPLSNPQMGETKDIKEAAEVNQANQSSQLFNQIPQPKDEEKEVLIMLKNHTLSYRSGLERDITLYRYWQEVLDKLPRIYSENIWNNKLTPRDKERIEDVRTIFGDPPNHLYGYDEERIVHRSIKRQILNYENREIEKITWENLTGVSDRISRRMFSDDEANIEGWEDTELLDPENNREIAKREIERVRDAERKSQLYPNIEEVIKKVNYKRHYNSTHKINFKDKNPEQIIERLKHKLAEEIPEDSQERINHKLEIVLYLTDLRTIANTTSEQKTGDELIEENLRDNNAQKEIDKLEDAKKFEKKCINKIMEDKGIPKYDAIKLMNNDSVIETLFFNEEKSSKLRVLKIKDECCEILKFISLKIRYLEELIHKNKLQKNIIASDKTEEKLESDIKEYIENINSLKEEARILNLWEFNIADGLIGFWGTPEELEEWKKIKLNRNNAYIDELLALISNKKFYNEFPENLKFFKNLYNEIVRDIKESRTIYEEIRLEIQTLICDEDVNPLYVKPLCDSRRRQNAKQLWKKISKYNELKQTIDQIYCNNNDRGQHFFDSVSLELTDLQEKASMVIPLLKDYYKRIDLIEEVKQLPPENIFDSDISSQRRLTIDRDLKGLIKYSYYREFYSLVKDALISIKCNKNSDRNKLFSSECLKQIFKEISFILVVIPTLTFIINNLTGASISYKSMFINDWWLIILGVGLISLRIYSKYIYNTKCYEHFANLEKEDIKLKTHDLLQKRLTADNFVNESLKRDIENYVNKHLNINYQIDFNVNHTTITNFVTIRVRKYCNSLARNDAINLLSLLANNKIEEPNYHEEFAAASNNLLLNLKDLNIWGSKAKIRTYYKRVYDKYKVFFKFFAEKLTYRNNSNDINNHSDREIVNKNIFNAFYAQNYFLTEDDLGKICEYFDRTTWHYGKISLINSGPYNSNANFEISRQANNSLGIWGAQKHWHAFKKDENVATIYSNLDYSKINKTYLNTNNIEVSKIYFNPLQKFDSALITATTLDKIIKEDSPNKQQFESLVRKIISHPKIFKIQLAIKYSAQVKYEIETQEESDLTTQINYFKDYVNFENMSHDKLNEVINSLHTLYYPQENGSIEVLGLDEDNQIADLP